MHKLCIVTVDPEYHFMYCYCIYSVNVIEGFIEVNMSWGIEDSVTCHFICVLGLKLNAYLLRLRHLKRVAEEVAIYKAAEPFYH